MKKWNVKGTVFLISSALLLGAAFLTIGACQASAPAPASAPTTQVVQLPEPEVSVSRTLTLGNVDSQSPTRKIEELQPLADYLAKELNGLGITEGRVVIAQNNQEMAQLISDGKVDVYVDALIPSLDVCEMASCEFIVRQWKGGEPTSNGVFLAARDSGVANLDHLAGKVIALQKKGSTVGFVLPSATVAERGYNLVEIEELGSELAATDVGYYIAGGDRNAMELLLRGDVAGAALGEKAFERFDSDIKDRIGIFDRTPGAPSQLVSVRPDLETDMVSGIIDLLVGLDQVEGGQPILEALRDTKKFDAIDQSDGSLDELKELIKLAPGSKKK